MLPVDIRQYIYRRQAYHLSAINNRPAGDETKKKIRKRGFLPDYNRSPMMHVGLCSVLYAPQMVVEFGRYRTGIWPEIVAFPCV